MSKYDYITWTKITAHCQTLRSIEAELVTAARAAGLPRAVFRPADTHAGETLRGNIVTMLVWLIERVQKERPTPRRRRRR